MRYLGDLSYSQTRLDVLLFVERYVGMFGRRILSEHIETDATEDAESSPNIKAARPADGWCREKAGAQQTYHVADPAAGVNEHCWRNMWNVRVLQPHDFSVLDTIIVCLIIEKDISPFLSISNNF